MQVAQEAELQEKETEVETLQVGQFTYSSTCVILP